MPELEQLNTPILFCVFNRLETVKQSFLTIKKAKPKRLYIAADGPRENKIGESEQIKEVISYIENNIDWNCEIHRNYSKTNLKSRGRISSAISWALENENEVIIMEDDIVPSSDFFIFCQTMLDYYRDDDQVMMVSGINFVKKYKMNEDYVFSSNPVTWGWATWKRAWEKYDDSMSDWPQNKKNKVIDYVAKWPSRCFLYWNNKYTYNHEVDAWDFVWFYDMHKEHGLGIVPRENMVKNIGFDSELATHTSGKCKYDFTYGAYEFPLKKITTIERCKEYDKAYFDLEYNGWRALWVIIKKVVLYIPKKILS